MHSLTLFSLQPYQVCFDNFFFSIKKLLSGFSFPCGKPRTLPDRVSVGTGLLKGRSGSPLSEAIAQWIFEKLETAQLPGLCMVEIRETCTSGAQYYRRDS